MVNRLAIHRQTWKVPDDQKSRDRMRVGKGRHPSKTLQSGHYIILLHGFVVIDRMFWTELLNLA